MKNLVCAIVIIASFIACDSNKQSQIRNAKNKLNNVALDVVNKRMSFYNQHDFEKFIKLYADDVKIYTYPDLLLGTGKENLTSIFKPKFAAKSLHVELVSQMNNGDYVINHEIVTENEIETKYVSIYEVNNGLIKSVKFVRDK